MEIFWYKDKNVDIQSLIHNICLPRAFHRFKLPGWLSWWLQSDLIGVYAVASLFYVLRSVIYHTKAVIARISISAD